MEHDEIIRVQEALESEAIEAAGRRPEVEQRLEVDIRLGGRDAVFVLLLSYPLRVCTEMPIRHFLLVVGHHPPIRGIFLSLRPHQRHLMQFAIVLSRQPCYASFVFPEIRQEVLLNTCSCPRVRPQVRHHLEELSATRPEQHEATINASQWACSA